MNKHFEDLEKLDDLLKKGIITEDEFIKEKERILSDRPQINPGNLFGLSENTYGFLLHISVFLGMIHLVLGLIAPIILWVLNKDKSQRIDQHGKNVVNWLLSLMIYFTVLFILILPINFLFNLSISFSFTFSSPLSLFTGFVPITILMVLNIVFIITGAVKANKGEIWKYPLAINFFS